MDKKIDLETAVTSLEVTADINYVQDGKPSELNLNHVQKKYYLFFKRLFDIVFSLSALVSLLVFLLIIAIILKISEPKGKIFYYQNRYGLNGKRFKMYKIRSMIENADQKLKENEVLYKKYLDNNYKLSPEEDPRMTKIGRIIRKYSIDEIPQFYNVLKGEMSIVGPRPIVDEELENEYKYTKSLFLSVKPGVTGYWQANGRSNISYPERSDMELYYVENCNFYTDIKIIIQTVKSILFKNDAY